MRKLKKKNLHYSIKFSPVAEFWLVKQLSSPTTNTKRLRSFETLKYKNFKFLKLFFEGIPRTD